MGIKHTKHASTAETLWIDERVKQLIQLKEQDPNAILHPFNKILLKTPFLRAVFQNIRRVFDKYAINEDSSQGATPSSSSSSSSIRHTNSGTHSTTTSTLYLPYHELQNVLSDLGAFTSISKPDSSTISSSTSSSLSPTSSSPSHPKINLTTIFSSADLYHQQRLTFREFLVCIALGYLLGTIHLPGVPDFSVPDSSSTNISIEENKHTNEYPDSNGSNHSLSHTRPSFSDSAARTLEGDTETAAAIAYESAQKLHDEEMVNTKGEKNRSVSQQGSIVTGKSSATGIRSIMRTSGHDSEGKESNGSSHHAVSVDSDTSTAVVTAESKEQEDSLRTKERLQYLSSLHNYPRRTVPNSFTGTTEGNDTSTNDTTPSSDGTTNPSGNKPPLKLRTSSLLTRSPSFGMNSNSCSPVDIAFAFHLVLEAYMQLDSQRKGMVSQNDLSSAMEEMVLSPAGKIPSHSHHHHDSASSVTHGTLTNGRSSKPSSRANSPSRTGHHNNSGNRSRSNSGIGSSTGHQHPHHPGSVVDFVTHERFHELDFNADGNVSFKEFLYTFVKWCGIEEDDDEDDEMNHNPQTIYNKIRHFFTKHHPATHNRSRSNSQQHD